ncbi:ATP-grasp domain-containing protein [Mangrovibrevibacter kandeliae]|uniref:ATP-grasp domain-containing protein n=1 Tax=Mangrovibrevibacter kandeliae TaxID=2968473 RepID=UPI00211821D2|nr:ATP-grasp domain-containing protein [Aurantimonas sp. CSK15Z-1]MCQ8783169.1 ATP-grasp domain-containing protein [Aurantimonas sp. CSK15Z-1]
MSAAPELASPSVAAPARDVVIATFSGRALAAAARRAGYRPYVADLFADNDLRDLADGFETVHGDFVSGFDGDELLDALDRLAARCAPRGVLCGPGFEDRPELLEAIAARWPLLGNGAAVVRALKDPMRFAALCAAAGIRHPETRLDPPPGDDGWLSKRVGAAGGLHIGAPSTRPHAADRYYQRFIEGERVSALFAAGRGAAVTLAFSRQWLGPTEALPFRYGGACGPVHPGADAEAGMTRAVSAVAAALPDLVGLGSADFLLGTEGPVLLEINPRPGASLEVFDGTACPLFAIHLDACEGRLPPAAPHFPSAKALGYAYLDRDEAVIARDTWPDWVSDRPARGTILHRDAPICTLTAEAATPDDAIALFKARLKIIKREVEGQDT